MCVCVCAAVKSCVACCCSLAHQPNKPRTEDAYFFFHVCLCIQKCITLRKFDFAKQIWNKFQHFSWMTHRRMSIDSDMNVVVSNIWNYHKRVKSTSNDNKQWLCGWVMPVINEWQKNVSIRKQQNHDDHRLVAWKSSSSIKYVKFCYIFIMRIGHCAEYFRIKSSFSSLPMTRTHSMYTFAFWYKLFILFSFEFFFLFFICRLSLDY